jgi:hypothetical protein
LNKLTLVLMGLFVMVSGLIGITAYVSNNQAFVKADTVVNIEFGTVFPGAVVTQSFTMDTSSSSGIPQNSLQYTITLEDTSGAGVMDIRDYLLVTKAPGETDTDGQISGSPYTCDGSLDKQNDQSDTWDVKFFVPDINGDYSCKLEITTLWEQ